MKTINNISINLSKKVTFLNRIRKINWKLLLLIIFVLILVASAIIMPTQYLIITSFTALTLCTVLLIPQYIKSLFNHNE